MKSLTIVCLSSEFKGVSFLRRLAEGGHQIYLITSKDEADKPWPWSHIKDTFYLERNERGMWNDQQLDEGFSWLMRTTKIDRIVALDDFEVERAARLRELFRIPGMGQTTARLFRDKLAMRVAARDAGILVPAFSSLFNDQGITDYLTGHPGSHVIKPRSEASASGIKKVHSLEEAWEHIHSLGDKRFNYLIEEFVPGDVFHVDGLVWNHEILFTSASRYRNTPMEVAHGGGIFQSITLDPTSLEAKELNTANKRVITDFGLLHGTFHSEYIRRPDGKYYFLETSYRVGGASLSDMLHAAYGFNLWAEWAQIECDFYAGREYSMPDYQYTPTGIIVSLIRYPEVNPQDFTDPEVVWRMQKDYHVGLVVQSQDPHRVTSLLDDYAGRIARDYHASMPSK